jgi:hypothetical protein
MKPGSGVLARPGCGGLNDSADGKRPASRSQRGASVRIGQWPLWLSRRSTLTDRMPLLSRSTFTGWGPSPPMLTT